MEKERPRILVLLVHYLPGFRSGGPVRSISNIVERFGDSFEFRIVTRDRDYLSNVPFEGIASGRWVSRGKAFVWYLPGKFLFPLRIFLLLRRGEYDLVFLNSLFERRFSILPLLWRRIGLLPHRPWVLAPRGELSEGALAIRSLRKRVFLRVAKRLRLFSGIMWQASHELEGQDIAREIGPNEMVRVIPDATLPGPYSFEGTFAADEGSAGEDCPPLKVIFLSRIAPKKNLKAALEALLLCREKITFEAYGPIDDRAYWEECLAVSAQLPPNVGFGYCGEIPHEKVLALFSKYDVFFFPTLGENYGHVIIEALAAGCPALLSNTTPWSDLDASEAGWVRPVGALDEFASVLDAHALKSRTERRLCAAKARAYAWEYFEKLSHSSATFEAFTEALALGADAQHRKDTRRVRADA